MIASAPGLMPGADGIDEAPVDTFCSVVVMCGYRYSWIVNSGIAGYASSAGIRWAYLS
jgi:hypothetical protein